MLLLSKTIQSLWNKMAQNDDAAPPDMLHHIYWIIEGQILILEIEAEAPHLISVYDEMILKYLDASLAPIDIIVKPPEEDSKPASLTQLTHLKILKHPCLGIVAVIPSHTNPITRFLVKVLSTVAGIYMRSF